MIIGTYIRRLYFNAETGQTAFLFRTDTNKCMKVVGKYCLQQEGFPLAIDGTFKNTEYGPEFHISTIDVAIVDTARTVEFLMKVEPELSEADAKAICSYSCCKVFMLAYDPDERFYQVTSVNEDHARRLMVKLRALYNELSLFYFLLSYNGTYEQCKKILARYPENTVEVFRENPYLVSKNAAIPLKLADQIALTTGTGEYSVQRIEAILEWCISRESAAGNTFTDIAKLYQAVTRAFGEIPKSVITEVLKKTNAICCDRAFPDDYYEPYLLEDETLAAENFARLMKTRKSLSFHPEFIEQIEKERGFAFGNQQRQAFQLLRTTGFKLLTGDPGTGKTTTVNGLLRYMEMIWIEEFGELPKFALCAPAGRAAQRMKETTARNAMTIHKTIEYQPNDDGEYFKSEKDPIDADIIVVDEVSMLGISTFRKLIGAIKNGSLILLVGDVNQLQSVEAGNVLQDIIDSGLVDRCHLSEVFRQAEESLINRNAKKIISGETNLDVGNDFKIQKCSPENIQKALKNNVCDLLRHYDASRIQVLSPVRKGSCGVKDGNTTIQNIFNPGKGGIWFGYRNYKLKDRVMMMSNNYALSYFNGDVGYITEIWDNYMEIQIGEEKIKLPTEKYGDMDLAYDSTVHKSQGSEYDYLIIVLQQEAMGMLDQNLLYTAVTRGKKEVRILYENDTLQKAITTGRTVKRNSHLVQRIYKELGI